MTVALFQKGKEFVWEGLELVMKVVNEAEVEAHKLAGWVMHPYDTIDIPTLTDAVPSSTEPAAVAPAPEPVQTAAEAAPATPAVVPSNPFAQG